jgi:hypothetical protein
MIAQKIARLKAAGFDPIVGPPTNYNQVCCELAMLETDGYPLIPDDYIDFLLEVGNGFAWNGAVLYGVLEDAPVPNSFFQITLYDYNQRWKTYEAFAGKLILGHRDDDLFVFNAIEKVYEIVDRVGKDALESYPDFESLFTKEI